MEPELKASLKRLGKTFFRLIGTIAWGILQVLWTAVKILLSIALVPFYLVRNSFKYRPVISSIVLAILIIAALLVWAVFAIPDFGVWLGFALLFVLFAHLLANAELIFIWWD
jgi:hypothetical protein